MWNYVGIVRSTTRIETAEQRIGELELEWETDLLQQGWEPTTVGIEVCEMRNLGVTQGNLRLKTPWRNLFCCAKLVVSRKPWAALHHRFPSFGGKQEAANNNLPLFTCE
ncbi:unnamed protein product [Ilex paraguariensis]|uniref:Uncharacterized protein n=1 Tax=Ilex paraguariensis TaxID=185542 RepID=A0ABC8SI94_9AQUA